MTAFAVARVDAAQVNVEVRGRDGRPVGGLVVALHASRPIEAKAHAARAVMDQLEQRFVPSFLVEATER